MPDDLRFQPKCYYASSDYSKSFWGKYIYIYQGKGSLHLKTDSLCLENCSQPVEIPFHAIESICLSRFSSWAKPLGLSRLTVTYVQEGESKTIHLVPYESAFDPTTVTSEITASWHQTLGHVQALTDRVQSSEVQPDVSPSFVMGWLASMVLILPVAVAVFLFWIKQGKP